MLSEAWKFQTHFFCHCNIFWPCGAIVVKFVANGLLSFGISEKAKLERSESWGHSVWWHTQSHQYILKHDIYTVDTITVFPLYSEPNLIVRFILLSTWMAFLAFTHILDQLIAFRCIRTTGNYCINNFSCSDIFGLNNFAYYSSL